MKIEINRIGLPFLMEGKNPQGNTIQIDASPSIGGTDRGVRPMELLLFGLGSCAGVDVVSILNKQRQEFTDFSILVDGEREEGQDANIFVKIHVHFKLKGNVEEEKFKRAIDLSLEKYCSVAKTLSKTATITSSFEVER